MDAQTIIDRRRLRRRASTWRLLAFIFLGVGLVAMVFATSGFGPGGARRAQVARVTVDGFIDTRPAAVKLIAAASKSDAVKAVLLRINSPGGAASGGEALYRAVRDAAEKKPVVAMIEGVGASGAYMTAIAADHIVARESAITGSIGVIIQFPHVEELLAKIGIEVEEVKSTPLKAEPGLFGEPSPAGLAMMRSVVDDTYEWFTGLVAERRDLSPAEARAVADGRIFTGRQALAERLVDTLGGEDEARGWLEDERGVSRDLPLVDWRSSEIPFANLAATSARRIAALLGIDPALLPFAERALPRHLFVDGLLMVWHAP
ncbi:MAG: signal peptide peptidase SppA [Caulobacterales bacterium]|nr:signal peptide peptidase SppA [Caulobacterales bacterium]